MPWNVFAATSFSTFEVAVKTITSKVVVTNHQVARSLLNILLFLLVSFTVGDSCRGKV
jgi:hypothetical protein